MGLGDRVAEDVDGGDRGRTLGQQPVEVEQQRGLAGAVGTDERHAFAFGHVESDVVKGGRAVGVAVAEAPDLQRVHVLQPRAHIAA